MADSNNTVVFTDLIPYQDWQYVEVIRDFHKHLGNKETKDKIGLLNEVIKPYCKAKGDALAALRYMSLAVYMGGIMTPDCMHALASWSKANAGPITHTIFPCSFS